MASPVQQSQLNPETVAERQASKAESVGARLRRKREEYGQDLDAIAMQLRIRNIYLQAIEESRFKDLPGNTYAVGFVRTYADYLGLDSQEILRRFREEVAELSGQPQLIFPAAAAEGKLPGGAILLLSLLLAAIAYGIWYYMSERQMNLLEMVPAVPEQLSGLISGEPAPAGEAVDQAPGAVVETAPAATQETARTKPAAADTDAGAAAPSADGEDRTGAMRAEVVEPVESSGPVDASAADASEQATPVQTAATEAPRTATTSVASAQPRRAFEGQAPVASPSDPAAPEVAGSAPGTSLAAIPAAPAVPPAVDAGQIFGTGNRGSRITLVARLESWVQVTDSMELTLWTRVLQAGDRYMVPNMPGLTLTTGNAGGLEILVDGRPAPLLGPVGAVRRGVPLDPERLTAGTALP